MPSQERSLSSEALVIERGRGNGDGRTVGSGEAHGQDGSLTMRADEEHSVLRAIFFGEGRRRPGESAQDYINR